MLVTPAALRALEPGIDPSWLVLVAEPPIVEGVTGFKFHRGCLALVRRPSELPPLSAFAQARRLVVLEAVGNPDNIGGIFRSATALGADAVLLDPACGDPFYRKAVRTSMGAVLRLPSTRVDPWLPGLATLRDMGFAIVALSPTGELTLEAFRATLSADARLALVAGAEGYGLSTATIAAADVTVRIPVDPLSDSLNIVVAVSIALSRLIRRLVQVLAGRCAASLKLRRPPKPWRSGTESQFVTSARNLSAPCNSTRDFIFFRTT